MGKGTGVRLMHARLGPMSMVRRVAGKHGGWPHSPLRLGPSGMPLGPGWALCHGRHAPRQRREAQGAPIGWCSLCLPYFLHKRIDHHRMTVLQPSMPKLPLHLTLGAPIDCGAIRAVAGDGAPLSLLRLESTGWKTSLLTGYITVTLRLLTLSLSSPLPLFPFCARRPPAWHPGVRPHLHVHGLPHGC